MMHRTPTAGYSNVLPILCCLLAACGGTTSGTSALPENIAAEPRGLVGIVTAAPTTSLPTALRALGVPYRSLPLADLDDAQLEGLALVVIDELALDDPAMMQSIPRMLDNTRTGGPPLLILMQSNERGTDVLRRNAAPFEARAITHGVDLVAPRSAHRALTTPNPIGPADLETYSDRTAQLARGRSVRAIIAGNLDRPDSSAAVLRAVYGKGAIYYVAFPLAARAAEGYPGDQRLLANLLSLGAGD